MANAPAPLSPRFGEFGGRYIPEVLAQAHDELTEAYEAARIDPAFAAELLELQRHYVGRPTALYFAERLTAECGGARIWLKREDLAHTGAHKINNAIGQALLAKRLGNRPAPVSHDRPRLSICDWNRGPTADA